MGGAVKGTAKQAKRLLRNQERAQADADIPEIPNAGQRLERIEKKLAKALKDMDTRLKTVEGRTGKMWKAFTEGGGA